MASYDTTASDITSGLQGGALSAATIAAIGAILGTGVVVADNYTPGEAVPAGVDALGVQANLTQADTAVGNADTIIQGAEYSAQIAFDANAATTAMVVGGAGNSSVSFATDKDVSVWLQGGMNDSVTTAAGDDSVTISGGSASVNTGAGNDTVIFDGINGAASINAGDGFDVVRMTGQSGYNVSSGAGDTYNITAISRAGDANVNVQNVNVVGFTNGSDSTYDQITVIADNAQQSLVAKLYQVALGREAIDTLDLATGTTAAIGKQLDGLEFWFNQNMDTQDLVYSFLNCKEFYDLHGHQSDTEYVTSLFQSLGIGADGTINGQTVSDYVAQIGLNPMGRFDVAWSIAASDQVANILGIDGTQYIIDDFGV